MVALGANTLHAFDQLVPAEDQGETEAVHLQVLRGGIVHRGDVDTLSCMFAFTE